MKQGTSWREIHRKLKHGEPLAAAEQEKLDKWAYVMVFVAIGISLPVALCAIVLSLLTVLCMP